MDALEERSRTGLPTRIWLAVEQDVWTYGLRQREVSSGSDLTAVVAAVGTHEKKGIAGRPCKFYSMSNGAPMPVHEVEGSITKVVECVELT